MNNKDFTIGILSVTSVILLAAFLILQSLPARPVQASGEGGTAGQYVVTTGFVDEQCEIFSILDTTTMRLNFYQLDWARNEVVLLRGMDTRMPGGPARDQKIGNRGR
jgi:hypothetical protein